MEFPLKESSIKISTEFPKLKECRARILNLKTDDPHRTIVILLTSLWEGMFKDLEKQMDEDQLKKSCSLGFVACASTCGIESYILEGYEINKDAFFTGKLEAEETKEKYKSFGYNPGWIVEIRVGPRQLLLSPRHFQVENERLKSLLRHECHRDSSSQGEVCTHWNDPGKSGIYLANLWNSIYRPIWRKQFFDNPNPRIYAAVERKKVLA